jgi:pyrroloquinoline quinone biosynthesis protein E
VNTPAAAPSIRPESRPRLPRGVRLTQNKVHGWALQAPERSIKADPIAVEILTRCTGEASFDAIVDDLARTFNAPRERIGADVAVVLRGLADKRYLELDPGTDTVTASGRDAASAKPISRQPASVVAGKGPAGAAPAANGHAASRAPLYSPLGMLAELTHRCPLGCPYCSNPLQMDKREDELDTGTWARVFHEAADLGIMQVQLSGGEPASRSDLTEITKAAREADLYTNLITSGIGMTERRLNELANAGVDHVQISIQDSEPKSADRIAGYDGAYARKRALAEWVVDLKIPLTANIVIHRANIGRIDELVSLALDMGASRVEIAHVQYYGWALKNRAALMPTREQVEAAAARVEPMRKELHGRIIIDAVVPDYYARFPKPCVGGWGRRSLNVTPSGRVLPCHAAESIPGLEFWSVKDHSLREIWENNPAFNAFRGTGFLPETCQTCDRRDIDFGGCRCQAFAIAGDARAADPVCHLSPHHHVVEELAAIREDVAYVYRRL